MKRILLLIALFSTLFAASQSNDTSRVLQPVSGDGFQWKRGKFDSAMYAPLDTFRLKKLLGGFAFGRNNLPYYKAPGSNVWTLFSSAGGSGTLTTFTAGTANPLFTTSVANPTTAPALSFTVSPSGAYTIYGNNAGSTGAPLFFTPILSSGLFQNQGSTTTVLHGNAAGNPTWAAVNLTTDVTNILPGANGGTSVLTTLGDWLNHDGTLPVRVAGNTTAIKKVLTQTGNGTISALPVFEPVIIANWTANPPAAGRTVITDGIGGVTDGIGGTLTDGVVGNSCPVIWTGAGLVFTVGLPCIYNIQNVQYTLPAPVNVTLAAADVTNPRFDDIIVNTSTTATSVAGTPQANPEIPTVDPTTQLILTSVFVAAGATTPMQVGQEIVRDEGAGGEATITKNLITSTDNYATNPFHLTISQRITAASNGGIMYWQKASGFWSKSAYNSLMLYVRNNVVFNTARNFNITLWNNATQVGVGLNLATYGYSKTITGSYQLVVLPMALFTGADAFNRIRLTNTGTGGTVDVQIDYVQLQSGIVTNPTPPQTWQQTLITGPDLTQNNTIKGGSHDFVISGNKTFTAAAGPGYIQIDSVAKTLYIQGAETVSIGNQNGAAGSIQILANLLGNTYSATDSIVVIDAISKVWKKVGVGDVVSAGGGAQNLQQVTDIGAITTHPVTADLYISFPTGPSDFISELTYNTNSTNWEGALVLREWSTGNGHTITLQPALDIGTSDITLFLYGNTLDTIATRAYARSAGGGGGSSLLPLTGTGTATGDITGDLNSHTLSISNTDGAIFNMNTSINLNLSGIGSISFNPASIVLEDDRGTPRGLEYDGDYSATYSARSLVDKAYVDSKGGFVTAVATDANYTVTTANVIELPVITSNRTLTLPTPAEGMRIIFKNLNNTLFTWTSGTNIYYSDNTAFTILTNSTTYYLVYINSKWSIVN